jgi:hypothetical protein
MTFIIRLLFYEMWSRVPARSINKQKIWTY